jgi:hypothetical protein
MEDSSDDSDLDDKEEADPWVEAADEFGRTRIMRKSQADQLPPPPNPVGGPRYIHIFVFIFNESGVWSVSDRK